MDKAKTLRPLIPPSKVTGQNIEPVIHLKEGGSPEELERLFPNGFKIVAVHMPKK